MLVTKQMKIKKRFRKIKRKKSLMTKTQKKIVKFIRRNLSRFEHVKQRFQITRYQQDDVAQRNELKQKRQNQREQQDRERESKKRKNKKRENRKRKKDQREKRQELHAFEKKKLNIKTCIQKLVNVIATKHENERYAMKNKKYAKKELCRTQLTCSFSRSRRSKFRN